MSKRLHILIVEDDHFISEILRHALMLQPENYTISCAYDGIQGIKQALETQPDLILLDVQMPRATGYEVAQILRAARSTTPIIMLTCDNNEAEGFRSGCNEYIQKPFKPIALCAQVRNYLQCRIA